MTGTMLEIKRIERVYATYCDALDLRQFDRLADVFSADCRVDYERIAPGLVLDGAAGVVDAARGQLGASPDVAGTHHMVSNFRIEVYGGRARAKVRFHAIHSGAGEFAGQSFRCWGDYDDRLVFADGCWRISHRVYHPFGSEGPVEIAGYAVTVPGTEIDGPAASHPVGGGA